ncbi:hypothetical protein HNR67_007875 [Crossiella cryophila]|uniref:Uncharacterized protein n=1 Tax=Crossiella cryophila TaxID=43355 RepID=A0A7W7FXX5_9PSEU|nr:hypothetical protein [Crossiella cryophila]
MTRKQPAPLSEALVAKTTRLLMGAVPSLDTDQAWELLIVAAGKNASMRQVHDFLSRHPDALRHGLSDSPLALGRLARLLVDLGVGDIVEPTCFDCGRTIARPHRVEGGRVCRRCYRHRLTGLCCRCGQSRPIMARLPEGVICPTCYGRETRELCANCGGLFRVTARRADGKPLCQTCRPRRLEKCVVCGTEQPVAMRYEINAVCKRCYRLTFQPRRECGRCGKTAQIAKAATAEQPDICTNCNAGPIQTCSVCGRRRPCHRGKHGVPRCE